MHNLELNGKEFLDVAGKILRDGHRVRFQARGVSMAPFILDGNILEICSLAGEWIKSGDVVLVKTPAGRPLVHRVIKTSRIKRTIHYFIKGDASPVPDGWFPIENILGRVEIVERGNQRIYLTSRSQKLRSWIWVAINPWISKFSWLPARLRRFIWRWLLVN